MRMHKLHTDTCTGLALALVHACVRVPEMDTGRALIRVRTCLRPSVLMSVLMSMSM